MHSFLTAAIWSLSLLSLAVAGLIAAEFALIPASIDIGELVTGGLGPWRDAAEAAGLFVVLLVATAVSLRLWHTARFKTVAWLLTLVELACVGWSSFVMYRDYL